MHKTARPSQEELITLRLAVEASGEIVFITDPDGTITYVNPEFVRVYGYEGSEVIGVCTPRILSGGTTPKDEYASFWNQLLNHQVVRREFVNRTKSGVLVHVESSANPIINDGRLIGFLAVQRDVTARKTIESALLESERRYRALAEAAQDAIFIVNRRGEFEYANRVTGELFGLQSHDMIGRRLHDIYPRETAERMWRDLSAVFESGTRQVFESRFDTANGELWSEAWLVPMCGETGEAEAVMGVARDITDRKQLQAEFAQAQKMEAVGRLAGGVAHDFNNLLTAILGYTELLLERVQYDASLVADLDEVKKAGERATRLTRQLLTFSRRQPLSPQLLDLNGVVAELNKLLERVIGEDIRLEISAGAELGQVNADSGQMEQVIMNLAVNARDAMPQGGTLRITTAKADIDADFCRRHEFCRREGVGPGQYVSITVQDSGCGMSDDVLAHVFEPFFTTKPAGKGTGLGLATVYGIMKQSKGFISIDSTPGGGTTVAIYFPAVSEPPAVASAIHAARNIMGGTETILLAEDEIGLRRLMRRALERHGYTVLESLDVHDALHIAEHHNGTIDLLLSDIVMPDLSGPDLAQRVAWLRPSIKVMHVSGFASLGAINLGSVSSRTSFLAKPFSPDTLVLKVRECLDH